MFSKNYSSGVQPDKLLKGCGAVIFLCCLIIFVSAYIYIFIYILIFIHIVQRPSFYSEEYCSCLVFENV